MIWWVFPSEVQAGQAEQLILILGARIMAYRADWPRDDHLRPLGKRASDGETVPGAVTTRYAVPRACAEGWAIPSPEEQEIWTGNESEPVSQIFPVESPAGLAAAAGLDPADMDWPALLPALLGVPYEAGMEHVEMTLPAVTWLGAVFAFYELTYVEMASPTFTDSGGLL